MLDELKNTEYRLVMLCRFGSHLYGTDTPESDVDYKGIYMPTRRQILTGKFPKSVTFDTNPGNTKNTSEDIDCELYSFHYFMELAQKGEMIAVDMLHADGENLIIDSPIWNEIRAIRSMFYTTEMKGFAGYARKQASKYGMKGARINSAETLLAHLKQFDPFVQMKLIWEKLPTDGNMFHKEGEEGKDIKTFYFCGKQIQSTVKIGYAVEMIEAFLKQYGHRAKKAAESEGTDWKAISHAMRAAIQFNEILVTGDLIFPLRQADLLRMVKQGKLPIDTVLKELEERLDTMDEAAALSPFPKKVDQEKVLDFIERVVGEHIGKL